MKFHRNYLSDEMTVEVLHAALGEAIAAGLGKAEIVLFIAGHGGPCHELELFPTESYGLAGPGALTLSSMYG